MLSHSRDSLLAEVYGEVMVGKQSCLLRFATESMLSSSNSKARLGINRSRSNYLNLSSASY